MQLKGLAITNVFKDYDNTFGKNRGSSNDSLNELVHQQSELKLTEKDNESDMEDNGLSDNEEATEESASDYTFLTSLHVIKYLQLLNEKEKNIFDLLFSKKSCETENSKLSNFSVDRFFLEVLPVTPSRFRPAAVLNSDIIENPHTITLSKIISICNKIMDIFSEKNSKIDEENTELKKEFSIKDLIECWIQLQTNINIYFDSSNPGIVSSGTKNNRSSVKANPPGIKQLLEKKEGLFRKNMMGKRVNYSARSVISPDPFIETNEIGVPPVFAKILTFPEPVTPFNIDSLKKAVTNGPYEWPGATHVQDADGKFIDLSKLSEKSREAVANQLLNEFDKNASDFHTPINKKVFRHLINGDLLLVNRQPTLHKPSIMAHKAKVLSGEKTIRMHYANCNTYNADFDGDEMNLHLPQNELARAEARVIAQTDEQYLVPTDGSPLRGLIQDHIVTGVLLTKKDTFLNKQEYLQLIYSALRIEKFHSKFKNFRITILPPSVLKPIFLWTGKQVVSTILINAILIKNQEISMFSNNKIKAYFSDLPNFESKTKISDNYWGENGKEESKLLVSQGEVMTGILDKSQLGASSFGLIHVSKNFCQKFF